MICIASLGHTTYVHSRIFPSLSCSDFLQQFKLRSTCIAFMSKHCAQSVWKSVSVHQSSCYIYYSIFVLENTHWKPRTESRIHISSRFVHPLPTQHTLMSFQFHSHLMHLNAKCSINVRIEMHSKRKKKRICVSVK